jgi:hypothetical protein
MAKEELNELRSALTELTLTIQEANGVNSAAISAKAEEIEASKNAARADNEEAAASRKSGNSVGSAFMKLTSSTLGTINAFYGLAKVIASIGEAGRKFAETTGTTASQGAQFQLDLIKTVRLEAKRFSADIQVTAAQLRGAATSFAEVFVGAANGMRISAEGSANFARSLNQGFKSEFQLTADSMRALVTVGASTTQQFEAFRKASGRAGLSSQQFANLVNKNTLSFMLYGPSFARAAVNAERLGISLSSVQKAQESMVTGLDNTIDTVAQINQLGGQIDFGTLTTLAETQGPEAVLSYLQSTIPPALFQSASTRALISGLGIPLEDLMKRSGSVQESAANKIEKAFSETGREASGAAKSLADLNKNLQALDESKILEMTNAAYGAATALIGLIGSLGGFAIALFKASMQLLKFPFSKGLPTGILGGGAPSVPGLPTSVSSFGGTPKTIGTGTAARTITGPTPTTQLAASLRRQNPGMSLTDAMAQARQQMVGTGYQTTGVGASRFVGSTTTAPGVGRAFGAVGTGLGRMGSGIATSVGRMGAFGVGAGILSVGVGAADAYRTARAAGKSKEEAAGNAAIQGGSAAVGTILGGFFGPAGAAIGGTLGNWFGKKINEWFPGLGKSIGETFLQMKTAAMPLIEKLKEFWGVMKGPLMTVLKVVGAIVGGVMVASFKMLGFVFTKIVAPVLGVAIKAFTLVAKGWVSLLNLMIKALNLIPGVDIPLIPVPGETPVTGPTTTGDDVVSRSGYGERALVTPGGTIALNNNDTVVAYADDLMSGIRTYSLGTLSRAMGNGGLEQKVQELINTIASATTSITVDNKIQQVPRIGLARVGVYTRNEFGERG